MKLHLLRFQSFDLSTEVGRTNERYRLALWGGIANVMSASMSFLALIITLPLTLSYLGEERFGVWMTFASMATMFSFLDLGIGNGLISKVAQSSTINRDQLRLTISRGLVLLVIIGLVVGIVATFLNIRFSLASLIKVNSEIAKLDAVELSWLFIGIFSLSIPFNGVVKIIQGLQRSYWVYIARLFGSLISLALTLILVEYEAGPALLLLATYGVQVLFSGILVLYLQKSGLLQSDLLGQPGSKAGILDLVNTGGLFFILQIGIMVGWGSDALILSSQAGAVAVTQFTIVQRVFQFVSLPLSILNGPLWAAYAEAKERRDVLFIKRTLRISFFGTLVIAIIMSSLIWLSSDYILNIWVGHQVIIPSGLIFIFAIWIIFEATGNAFSMFLNGMHEVRIQLIAVFLFLLMALPLKIYIAPDYAGVGVVSITLLSYLFGPVCVYIYFYRKFIKL